MDRRRALLTSTQRERLRTPRADLDVDDHTYYAMVSDIRSQVSELPTDLEVLRSERPDIYATVVEAVLADLGACADEDPDLFEQVVDAAELEIGDV